MNRLYPVGIQNFEKIRKNGYIYVDKTALLYQLVKTGQYYFLSRPRRFGKSLTISTLEAYFTGKRELFKGLDMEQLEKDWTVHPVLHMDLNTEKYDTEESLEHKLELTLKQWEEEYGSNPDEYSVATRFEGVIRRAALKTGCNVVILIDEYDKPILQTISKPELQTEYRNTLKAFYGALKSCDGYIRFAMLTGVTKFSKVSVFSDLNNLMDISMDRRYAELCGISDAELHKYFEEDIHALADELGTDYAHACELLKVNYDGYHFCYKSAGMYNPFSLLNTFAKRQIGSYWFETGTPTYLVELMKLHHYNVEEIEHIVTSGPVLDSIDAASTDPVPVIYQPGVVPTEIYSGVPSFMGMPVAKTPEEQRCRRFPEPPAHLLRRYPIRTGTLPGSALPEHPVHRFQADGIPYRGGIPYLTGTGGPCIENRRLYLCHGVQTGRNGRRSHEAN